MPAAARIGESEWWGRWFDLAGVESTRDEENDLGFTADIQVYEVASAISGQGVAMGSPTFFQRERASGMLVQPFDIVAENTSGHYVVYPEERRRSPKIILFRDWLLAEAKEDPAVQELIAAGLSALAAG